MSSKYKDNWYRNFPIGMPIFGSIFGSGIVVGGIVLLCNEIFLGGIIVLLVGFSYLSYNLYKLISNLTNNRSTEKKKSINSKNNKPTTNHNVAIKPVISFNTIFVHRVLKHKYLHSYSNFDFMYQNKTNTIKYLNSLVMDVFHSNNNIVRNDEFISFLSLNDVYFTKGNEEKGIVVVLPCSNSVESECNYIALCKKDTGELIVYTSEYYSNINEFWAIKEDENGNRQIGLKSKTVNDLNSFLDIIDHKIVFSFKL